MEKCSATSKTCQRPRWPLLLRIAGIVAVTGVIGLAIHFLWNYADEPIALPTEYSRVDVNMLRHGQEVAFTLPEHLCPELIAALRPLRPDPHPAKWQYLGLADFFNGQGSIRLVLFDLHDEAEGAALIERGGRRQYFRCGSTKAVKHVLEKAYTESLKEEGSKPSHGP
jgi:hypothetical protein